MLKRFLLIGTLSVFVGGCASTQPPAPVYGSGAKVYSKPTPKVVKTKPKPNVVKPIEQPPVKQEIPEVLTTKPLAEPEQVANQVDMLIEPLTPMQQEQIAASSKQEPALSDPAANISSTENRAERQVEDISTPKQWPHW